MIEGIKIRISSEELKQHLAGKAKLHKEKASFYEAQVSNLEKGADENQVGGSNLYNASNNPIDSLKNSAKKHQQRVDYFEFLVKYIVSNEEYELTESDLTKLEVISGMYF